MNIKILTIVFAMVITQINAQNNIVSIDSLIKTGRYKQALSILDKSEETFKSNSKIAIIYEAIDNHKKASEFYKKALTFKDDYRTKIKLGKSLIKQQKIKEAITLFEEVSVQDENNLFVKYMLGKLYLQRKKAKKAKIIFNELIKKDLRNANYHYQLGLANMLLGEKNKRIDNFLAAYDSDKTHFKAIEKLARVYTKLRDKDSARLFTEKGLYLNPNHINLNRLKINALYLEKKYKQSILLLNRIDSLAPKEHYTNKMLAKCYYQLKDYEKAAKYFSIATKLDYEDFKSHRYLGDIYYEQDKTQKAMYSYFLSTYVGKKTRDKGYMGLAKVYSRMKLPKRVIEQYKLAIKENRKNHLALYELARISENFYKDKKIAYNLFTKYIAQFEGKDKDIDAFVKNRLNAIKKEYFLKGEPLK
ncbi:tetratricopeptide repeat protein [Tenacibaculum sp. M341]|uniref:tetratricopeptide repeat protein n=1 Tax=Tenacibaculum sp. M341 TaxID=2530339 RepID=UPI00104DB3FD|nr:tetratricopeptide repeat protein [Tenacibaculum sp. M341]TCI85192.1 tetratricopeptide repeat protein [Tenacibaculum sp. M341]